MKKLYVLIIALLMSTPIFALPEWLPDFTLSGGGGGIFNIHWKDATLKDQYKDYTGNREFNGIPLPMPSTQDAMRQGLFDTKDLTMGGGIYGFLDATFAEFGAALVWNNVRQTVAIPNLPDVSPTLRGEETYNYLFTQLNLSLLLKYPFSIGERLKVFPLAGIDGQIGLGDYDDNMKRDFQKVANLGYDMPNLGEFWNSLWIRFGLGTDFALVNNLFLRCEALYGFKLNSKYEADMADYWAEDIKGVANGVNIRLGIGYTFKNFSK